jgi:hypothetical protein
MKAPNPAIRRDERHEHSNRRRAVRQDREIAEKVHRRFEQAWAPGEVNVEPELQHLSNNAYSSSDGPKSRLHEDPLQSAESRHCLLKPAFGACPLVAATAPWGAAQTAFWMAPPLPPSAQLQNAMRQFRVALLFNLFDAPFTNGTAGCRPKRFKFTESVGLGRAAATDCSLPSVSCEFIAISIAVKIRNVLCYRLGGKQGKNNGQRL